MSTRNVKNIQIRSCELLKRKIYFVNWAHFFMSLKFGISFMLLGPQNMLFLQLEKLRYLERNFKKKTNLFIEGLGTGTRNLLFPKPMKHSTIARIFHLLLCLGLVLYHSCWDLFANCSHFPLFWALWSPNFHKFDKSKIIAL